MTPRSPLFFKFAGKVCEKVKEREKGHDFAMSSNKKAKQQVDEEWGAEDEEEDEPMFEDGALEPELPAFLAGGALRAKQVWTRPDVAEEVCGEREREREREEGKKKRAKRALTALVD